MTVRPGGPARTLLARSVGCTLVAGAVSVILATVSTGRQGLLSALVGVGLVLGFLLVGQVPVGQAARGRSRLGAALLVALYVTRVVLLLVAFRLVVDGDEVDREVLGLTVIGTALGWTAGTVWSALRWRPMVVEPEAPERSEQR